VTPRGCLFDAYGTLFDVHSVVQQGAAGLQADLPALSALWRQKQLEYTWLRSLMGRYQDFWEITKAALAAAVRQLKIEASDGQLQQLLEAYLFPAAFPDAKPALESLQAMRPSILSNGTEKMVESAVRHNAMESHLAGIISVDRIKTYKPSPLVYALGAEMLKLPAGEILFVSSNSWDAAGAKAFGYRVCWCNRAGAWPEHLGFAPDIVVSRLDQIPAAL